MNPVIITSHLCKRFGNFEAVSDLSLSVQEGEIFGLLGPNGAGKTTVLKMLVTLMRPSSGSAVVAGADITREPAKVRRLIGYVPQLLSADGSLTGFENLEIFARLYDVPPGEVKARVREALEKMGLSGSADKLVRNYSGGMIRRLEIAQSILHRPRVIFLDEPTVGLDPVARKTVWDYIKKLRDEYGTTIFLTTHYMEEADLLCERVAILHRGHLVTMGSPKELKASVGPNATMDDVFAFYAGNLEREEEQGEGFREAQRERAVAKRLG